VASCEPDNEPCRAMNSFVCHGWSVVRVFLFSWVRNMLNGENFYQVALLKVLFSIVCDLFCSSCPVSGVLSPREVLFLLFCSVLFCFICKFLRGWFENVLDGCDFVLFNSHDEQSRY
jgi:hypothetical protein